MWMSPDDRLYISTFISGAVYIFQCLEIQFSMCQMPKSACVIFFSPFISCGSSPDMGYKNKRNYWLFRFIWCQSEMERTCGFIRTLTRLYRRLHGRQTRIFQFSSTMRGGKLAIAALPLLSSAVKWIFQFSSAVRGGKLEITDTLRVHLAEIYQSDFLSCFPFLCFLVGHWSRLSSTKWWMDMYVWKTIRWNNIKSK